MKNLLLLGLFFATVSCNNEKDKVNADNPNHKQDEVFPLGMFFSEQVHLVDSLRLPTVKQITIKDKTTTESISLEEFRSIAQEFINSDISNPSISKFYKETSFADQSIPSV